MDDQLTTGLTLRRARDMAGMDERTAAKALGIRRRDLRAIERGRKPASADLLGRAVDAYGGSELRLPERQELIQAAEPGVLVVGAARVSVDLARHDDRTLLSEYLTAVRRQRGLGPTDPVAFRSTDLVALAGVLDLASDDLERQLAALAGMTGATARRTAQMLVLTGLCVLAAGGVTWARAADGAGQSATPVRATPIGADVAGLVDTRAPFVVERHAPSTHGAVTVVRGDDDSGVPDADDVRGAAAAETGSPFSTTARFASTDAAAPLPLFVTDSTDDRTGGDTVGVPGTDDGGTVEDAPAFSDETAQEEAAKKADEQRQRDEEEAAKKKVDEEEAAKKADEQRQRDEEEAAKKKADEEEAAKKANEEEQARKKADREEAAKKQAEERAAKKKAAEEAAAKRKADREEAAKKQAEERAAKKKAAEEAAAKRKAEREEAAKKRAEERAAHKKAEEAKKAEEQEQARKAEEVRKAEEQEQARKKADEEEQARKAEEVKKAEEQEQARKAEEAKKAEEQEQARKKADEEEQAKKREEENKREEEAKKRVEEESARKKAEEREAQKKRDEDAKKKDEESKRKDGGSERED